MQVSVATSNNKDKDTSIILVSFPVRVEQSSIPFPNHAHKRERRLLAGGVELTLIFFSGIVVFAEMHDCGTR